MQETDTEKRKRKIIAAAIFLALILASASTITGMIIASQGDGSGSSSTANSNDSAKGLLGNNSNSRTGNIGQNGEKSENDKDSSTDKNSSDDSSKKSSDASSTDGVPNTSDGGNSKNGDSNSSNNSNNSNSSNNNSNNGNSGNNSGDSGDNKPKEDVITTKEIADDEAIPFQTETSNERDLPRGEVKVARAGINGTRRTIIKQTFKNGDLISSEIVSSDVIAEPVNQLNLIGISDFNLNNSYIQLYPTASVSREGSSAPASMVLVNGNYFINFWYDPITWARYAPASALLVSNGSFSYDGNSYGYDVGSPNTSYALTEAFCAEYGLACGWW